MTREMRRRKLFNYSIKRGMQLRILIKVLTAIVLAGGLTSVIFYFYSNQEVGATYRQFHINIRNFLDILLPGVIAGFVAGIAGATVFALFLPHRIAGPLHRMEKEIKEKIGEGDLTVRFAVRGKDEMKDLADSLNVMVEKLRARVERVKGAAGEISTAARSGGDLKDIVERLEEAVGRFKT